MLQRFVDSAVIGEADVGIEVDEEAPQCGVRRSGGGRDLDDLHQPRLGAVDGIAGGLSAGLQMDGEAQRRTSVACALAVGEPRLPELPRPVDPPDRSTAHGLVDLLQQRPGLLSAEQADHPVAEVGTGTHGHEPLVSPDLGHVAGDAVPEAAVDRGFGGIEGGDRLAALVVQVGELLAHHRGEDAATPVGGQDRDQRDAGDGRDPAGDGHDAAVDRCAADNLLTVVGGDRAVGFE
jgi:hypothetical protein